MTEPTARDLRAAKVAHVLSRAVRDGEIEAADALRMLRHELRRRNTNSALRIEQRSQCAQASIDKYAPDPPPKNGSSEALHADHVHTFTAEMLVRVDSVEGWLAELDLLRSVVCVTAAENYVLEKIERGGITGPAKYAAAGISFVSPV